MTDDGQALLQSTSTQGSTLSEMRGQRPGPSQPQNRESAKLRRTVELCTLVLHLICFRRRALSPVRDVL
jgi:hypothetical protein